MRFLQSLLAALTLSLFAATAGASPTNPQNGIDYKTLAKAQPTDAGKKVEVLEFFGYFCPHCYALDPAVEAWVKKEGDKIAFKRVHVLFDPRMQPMQQTYVTLEVMGKNEELHKKFFDAMHKQHLRLDTLDALTEFVSRNGVDKQKFLEVYNSFGVQTKMRRAAQLLEAYGVDSVPMLVVDGRYMTAPDVLRASLGNQASEATLSTATMQVLDGLVDKVIKERQAAAPAAKEVAKKK